LSLDKLHKIAEKGLRDGLQGLGFDVGGNVSSYGLSCQPKISR
jgi:hypothetical protein